MSSGTLIEAPPVEKAGINDRLAVDRGGVEWRGWVRALNGDSGALMQWDNGSQGGMLWSEKWRKLPKEAAAATPAPAPLYPTCDNGAAVMLELARIQPFELNPREFRTLPDGSVDPDQHGLRELAESLRLDGQKMPVKVRPLGDGRFGLVDGERRFQAAKLAGFTEIRVEVVVCSDEEALADTVVASNHAEPYAIADLARAVRYLLAKGKPQVEIARLLKTNQQEVSVLKRFSQLPGPVQELAREGKLQSGHIRQLVRDHLLRVPKAVVWIAQHAVETHASVRRLEAEIPFEEEMPGHLRQELRPQPAMELGAETVEPPVPEATPPPGADQGEQIAALQEQAILLAREHGHELGEWKESDTQYLAKCINCTGTAAILTAESPMGFSLSGTLKAPCQKTTPHRPGVEIVPPQPTANELDLYVRGTKGMPPAALVREYEAWRDATDPEAYRWRANAAYQELQRRREAGVDPSLLKWCQEHSDYACRSCAAITRTRAMAATAGMDPDAMQAAAGLQTPATAPAADPDAFLCVHGASVYGACKQCEENEVASGATVQTSPAETPSTAPTTPGPAPTKPRALKSAEEIAAENAAKRTTAPPAPAAPKLPEGWSGQPIQTLIPATLKASLDGYGAAVIPALNTYCQLAEVAKDNGLQPSELVGYVARFLAYVRWKDKSAEAILARYETLMQAEEE